MKLLTGKALVIEHKAMVNIKKCIPIEHMLRYPKNIKSAAMHECIGRERVPALAAASAF